MKLCKKCGIEKSLTEFPVRKARDGSHSYRNKCRSCASAYLKENYRSNKLQRNQQCKRYYNKFRDNILQKRKEYYADNKDKILEYKESYREDNKDLIKIINNRSRRKSRRSNPVLRIRESISRIISKEIKRNNSSKDNRSIFDFLPYSILELKKHLESQFEYWMNWDNYGPLRQWSDSDVSTWTWNIDHIIPQSILPYSSMQEDNFNKCWELKNLRPMSSKQNTLDGVNRVRHF